MLAQTDYEFAPTLLVLVLELDASRTACHSLGHRDHSVLDKDPGEKRRLPQPGVAVGGMRAGPLRLPRLSRWFFPDSASQTARQHIRPCSSRLNGRVRS